MLASSRLFVVIGVVACTTPRLTVERQLEREVAVHFGIFGTVDCPAVEAKPEPGESVTCDFAETSGEKYRVMRTSQTWSKGRFTFDQPGVALLSSDGIVFPRELMESEAKVRLECANQQRYLRVALGSPGYCKITGSDDYLRVTIEDVKTQKWKHGRVAGPVTAARSLVARANLDASVTCGELVLAENAPATCAIKTRSGEQFDMMYVLGATSYQLLRDGSKVALLPTVLTKQGTYEEVPLQCPRRVVRPDEAVRCSTTVDGTQTAISIAIDANGRPRLF